MTRSCVLQVAEEAGVSPDLLTTMADIYSGPTGLPDVAPYNETVVLKPGTPPDHPDVARWEDYLWRAHMARNAGKKVDLGLGKVTLAQRSDSPTTT